MLDLGPYDGVGNGQRPNCEETIGLAVTHAHGHMTGLISCYWTIDPSPLLHRFHYLISAYRGRPRHVHTTALPRCYLLHRLDQAPVTQGSGHADLTSKKWRKERRKTYCDSIETEESEQNFQSGLSVSPGRTGPCEDCHWRALCSVLICIASLCQDIHSYLPVTTNKEICFARS